MTRWNTLLHSPVEHEAPASRRWWLGWLQLLCAWVLCMLLCANIALVFAEGLPVHTKAVTSGSPAGCAVKVSAAQPGPEHSGNAGLAKGRVLVC